MNSEKQKDMKNVKKVMDTVIVLQDELKDGLDQLSAVLEAAIDNVDNICREANLRSLILIAQRFTNELHEIVDNIDTIIERTAEEA